MNKHMRNLLATLVWLLIPTLLPATAAAQGTAITYQGRLNGNGAPANGSFDLQFTLYATNITGNALAGPLTNSAIAVSNGLFTTTVDFGQGVFTGQPLWLNVSVSPAGSNTFTELTPRQPITSTPYAIQSASATVAATAGSVSAANISGTINAAQLPPTVVTNGATNVNISGTFSGNGANITGVNLLNINSEGAIGWATNWGNFAVASSPAVGAGPYFVTAADINGDGKVDLISGNIGNDTLTVLTNNGSGGFTVASSPAVSAQPLSIAAADVNGDGKIDLICVDFQSKTLAVLTNSGNGQFATASLPAVGNGPIFVTTADVNGDGKIDLVCANEGDNTLTILTNNGTGGFVTASSPSVGLNTDPESVTAADVNGDGKVDLISANFEANTLTVLTNNGSGGFTIASSPAVGNGPIFVTTADVNRDGKVDLISANINDNTLTVLTNNGSGGFTIASTLAVGSEPASVAAADINNDGNIDLISANEHAGTLTVLTNNGSGGFTIASTLAQSSAPSSVAAADVNGDGGIDLICAGRYSNKLTVLTNRAAIKANGSGLNWGTSSYTPTIGDGVNNFTTSTAQGYYSQMGNVTFVEIRLVWTDKGSANAGYAVVVSLPYAIGSSQRAVFTLGFDNGIAFNNQLMANCNLGETNIDFWGVSSGGVISLLPVSSCATSGEIQLSGFYRP